MNRTSILPLAALLLATATALPTPALERTGFSMDVLIDGVPVQEYAARGKTYVEAVEGREYAVRLTNHTGSRIAVALGVDGLNSIDARVTSAAEASKWILAPWETITLSGWQTSSSSARRFFFTTEDRSYGAWLGQTRNLGLISAAFFAEKRPQPVPIARPAQPQLPRPLRSKAGAGGRSSAPAESPAPAESAAPEKFEARGDLSDDLAATGIGQEYDHQVQRVSFEAEARPRTVLEVRYEFRDALVDLGVLNREGPRRGSALHRREGARGFEPGFAPDPYRR